MDKNIVKNNFWLVLGWGAARSLIQIGVWKRMNELWYKPIEIAWTSMWAIIGTCIATWMDVSEVEKLACDTSIMWLLDTNLLQWLVWGKKIMSFLESTFWDISFSDLKIPLKIVAADITSGEKVIFSSWSVLEAIRASISIPTIFSPVERDGETLVDWGIIENLPVQEIECNEVVAVSSMFQKTQVIKKSRKILWFDIPYSFFSYNKKILQKTILTMMLQNENLSLNLTDKKITVIRPDMTWFWFYDFDKAQDIIDLWYEEAKNRLQ